MRKVKETTDEVKAILNKTRVKSKIPRRTGLVPSAIQPGRYEKEIINIPSLTYGGAVKIPVGDEVGRLIINKAEGEDVAKASELHEYGHLLLYRKIFPYTPEQLKITSREEMMIAQAVADTMVNILINFRGLSYKMEPLISKITPPSKEETDKLGDKERKILRDGLLLDLMRLNPVDSRLLHTAYDLDEIFKDIGVDNNIISESDRGFISGMYKRIANAIARSDANGRKISLKTFKEWVDAIRIYLGIDVDKEDDKERAAYYMAEKAGKGSWGKMRIIDMIKEGRIKSRIKGIRKRVRTFFGGFKYVNRALPLVSDGRCWEVKKPKPGGTMLIDCSGSMGFSAEEVMEIINARPAMKVALYAQSRGRYGVGDLIIVVDNGMIADIYEAKSKIGGGNVIDGPALMWLAEQQEPRIWVSDGWVTGKDERGHYNLLLESVDICRKYNIVRVDNLKELIAAL